MTILQLGLGLEIVYFDFVMLRLRNIEIILGVKIATVTTLYV